MEIQEIHLKPELALPARPVLLSRLDRDPAQFEEKIQYLDSQVSFLAASAEDFILDVVLFDHLARIKPVTEVVRKWAFVPLRDGALALRNYALALSALRGGIGQVPHWLDLIEVDSIKQAEASFFEFFPFAHKLRHSVAHAEHFYNPQKQTSISSETKLGEGVFLNAEGASVSVRQGLNGDRFFSTFDGEFIEYASNFESAKFVSTNVSEIFGAFDRVKF